MPGKVSVDIDASNDKRAKEITLTAFIDTEVRLELLWVMHFLVP